MPSKSPWSDELHAGPAKPMSYPMFATCIAFISLATWLVIEVNVSVPRQFRRHGGLYFWSILISSWGTFLHTLGYVLTWWAPYSPWILDTCIIMIGWTMMVTFQSLVLYSRLHLVILNRKVLRGVLILIIATAIVIEIPQWVTSWGATNTEPSMTKYWTPIDAIMVRISQMAFLLQESLLSCLYIWGAVQLLTPNAGIKLKRVMWELITISASLIVLDIIILTLAYTNQHHVKEPLQGFVYALKLKMEFVILNQLVAVLGKNKDTFGGRRYRYGSDSRKKSSAVGRPKAEEFGFETSATSNQDSLNLPVMSPSADDRHWRSASTDISDHSSETRVVGTSDYEHGMRPHSRSNLNASIDKSKVAWVRHDIDITREP